MQPISIQPIDEWASYWLNERTLMVDECTDYDKYKALDMACSINECIDLLCCICVTKFIRANDSFASTVIFYVLHHSPDHLIYLLRPNNAGRSNKTTHTLSRSDQYSVPISMEIRIRFEWEPLSLPTNKHFKWIHSEFALMRPNASYINKRTYQMTLAWNRTEKGSHHIIPHDFMRYAY